MVKVKSGYARNYLIPYKKALMATKENRTHFEENRAIFEQRMKENQEKAVSLQERVNQKSFTLAVATNEGGKLFGSVGAKEISEVLQNEGYEISSAQVMLPSGSLRVIGTYKVSLHIYQGCEAEITLNIIAQS